MISVLCGYETHPVVPYVRAWAEQQRAQHREIHVHFTPEDLTPVGVLFVLSYGQKLSKHLIDQFDNVIVLHASDLPKGRGWSPYIWEILSGADHITLSAITAAERVDEGDIWVKTQIPIEPTDVYSDINEKLFAAEVNLIERVLEMIDGGETPIPQQSDEAATYYRRRTPDDSRVELNNSLGEIFDLLRTADPKRYPVFFEKDGIRFNLLLEKTYEDS